MRLFKLAACLATSAVLTGLPACARDMPTKTVDVVASSEDPNIEGEVFGNIWQNGARASGNRQVILEAITDATQSRLRQPHSDTIWADPEAGLPFHGKWMLEWSDPADGGQCGGLTTYLAGGDSARQPEAHWPAPGQPPQGKERHCVRPGTYRFTVTGVEPSKVFRVDYIPLALASGILRTVYDSTKDTTQWLESFDYDDASGNPVHDLPVHVDLTPSGSDTPVLDVENAFSAPTKSWFKNQPNPSGTELDWYRFSGARSVSTWSVAPSGKMLSRLYWDLERNPGRGSNYFNGHAPGYVIRHYQRFVEHVLESRNAIVALELMRPDEAPNDTINTARRTIAITRVTPGPPVACATFQGTTTWRTTDQYLSAGCSTLGANIQYRWQFQAGGRLDAVLGRHAVRLPRPFHGRLETGDPGGAKHQHGRVGLRYDHGLGPVEPNRPHRPDVHHRQDDLHVYVQPLRDLVRALQSEPHLGPGHLGDLHESCLAGWRVHA